MDPLYHPRLKDQEVGYAITLRHTHDRIKSGILVMAGASTLYVQQAMPEDAYTYLLRKAEETYLEAARELRALEPPASLTPLHRQYLDGFEDYQRALTQLRKLVGNADRQRDRQWLVAVADLMHEGTRKIKRVTLNLWLDEYITEHGAEISHRAEEMEEEIRETVANRDPTGSEGPHTRLSHDSDTVHQHHGDHRADV